MSFEGFALYLFRAFCYFNNVALAAKAMIARNKKVAIVDWVSVRLIKTCGRFNRIKLVGVVCWLSH